MWIMCGPSFWQIQQKESDSWYWKYLLQCRGELQNHISIIGKGDSTSLWFDWWLDEGPLYRIYGDSPWYAAGLDEGAKVEGLIKEGRWSAEANERQEEIVKAAESIPITPNVNDRLVHGEAKLSEWRSREVKNMLRPRGVVQEFKNLLWFKHCVPRFSLVAWTTVLNKLPTVDRLRAWGLNAEETCVLCRRERESRDHIFFDCSFAQGIWKEGLRKTYTHLPTTKWEDIVLYLRQNGAKGNGECGY